MSSWSWLFGNEFAAIPCDVHQKVPPAIPEVNPATGLLMLNGGSVGVDVGGNPYGADLQSISSESSSTIGFDTASGSDFQCDWPT